MQTISKLLFTTRRSLKLTNCLSKILRQEFSRKSPSLTSKEFKPPLSNFKSIDEDWEDSVKEELVGSDSQTNQMHIKKCEDLPSLISIYQQRKEGFNLVNYLTTLNQAVKLRRNNSKKSSTTTGEKGLVHASILEITEVKEILLHLKNQIAKMNNFAMSNFLSNLAKLSFYDKDIVERICSKLEGNTDNLIMMSSIAVSYLIWSFGRFQYKNENVLQKMHKTLMKDEGITVKSACNIMWGLSELRYKKEDLIQKLEKIVVEKSVQLDATVIFYI
jgi:hypothetical protein